MDVIHIKKTGITLDRVDDGSTVYTVSSFSYLDSTMCTTTTTLPEIIIKYTGEISSLEGTEATVKQSEGIEAVLETCELYDFTIDGDTPTTEKVIKCSSTSNLPQGKFSLVLLKSTLKFDLIDLDFNVLIHGGQEIKASQTDINTKIEEEFTIDVSSLINPPKIYIGNDISKELVSVRNDDTNLYYKTTALLTPISGSYDLYYEDSCGTVQKANFVLKVKYLITITKLSLSVNSLCTDSQIGSFKMELLSGQPTVENAIAKLKKGDSEYSFTCNKESPMICT